MNEKNKGVYNLYNINQLQTPRIVLAIQSSPLAFINASL